MNLFLLLEKELYLANPISDNRQINSLWHQLVQANDALLKWLNEQMVQESHCQPDVDKLYDRIEVELNKQAQDVYIQVSCLKKKDSGSSGFSLMMSKAESDYFSIKLTHYQDVLDKPLLILAFIKCIFMPQAESEYALKAEHDACQLITRIKSQLGLPAKSPFFSNQLMLKMDALIILCNTYLKLPSPARGHSQASFKNAFKLLYTEVISNLPQTAKKTKKNLHQLKKIILSIHRQKPTLHSAIHPNIHHAKL